MAGNSEKINTGVVDTAAGVIENCNNNMNDAVESLQNNINQFGWGWIGPASENAKNAFNELKNSMNTGRSNAMAGYSTILRQAISPGYNETEQTNTTLADNYKGW